jgi:hypothetical protein
MQKARPPVFKGRHVEPEIMLLCARRYLGFSLSYRNLEELMAERNLAVDHVTIQDIETVNMIRKGQVRWLPKDDILAHALFIGALFGVSLAP